METVILIWPTTLVAGATLCSAAIACLLCRGRGSPVAAASVGGLLPASAIVATCFYLDGGDLGYYLLLGLPLTLLATLFGSAASVIVVLAYMGLRDRSGDPGLSE